MLFAGVRGVGRQRAQAHAVGGVAVRLLRGPARGLGRGQRLPVRLQLRQGVGHVAEGGQHGLLVLQHRRLIALLGGAAFGQQRAAVEDRLRQRRAHRPDRARARQRRWPTEAAFAHRRRQRQTGEQLRRGHADVGRRRAQHGLGDVDVGPRRQQFGRHQHRHLLGHRDHGEGQVRRGLIRAAAHQHRQRVARGLPLRAQARQRGFQRGGVLVGLQRVVLRGRAQLVAALGVARHLARQHHLLFGQRHPLGQRG